jgi:carboxyl-terminal processing protease
LTERRSGTVLFSSFLVVLTGASFATGSYLRERGSPRLGVRPATQLAQAPIHGGPAYVVAAGAANSPHTPRASSEDQDGARRTFETVYSLVEQYYVDSLPSDRRMSHGAVQAMISSLNDPNCYFLEPDQFALLDAEGSGRFSGIGASLYVRPQKRSGYTDYKIVVVAALPGSPAEKAGLKSGDVITHVDGKWVLGYDPFLKANKMAERLQEHGQDGEDDDALRKEISAARRKAQGGIGLLPAQMVLRGDRRTIGQLKLPTDKRSVTVERTGISQPITLTMAPAVTVAPALSARTLSDGIGYVKIPVFTDKTTEEFRAALASLPEDRGLVLDLRGNPGGLLDAAMNVETLLSASGTFGYEVGAGGKQTPLKPTSMVTSGPARKVIVLVNRGTASVAEAVAASLMDQGVATIVGGQTFGDASVQMAYSLPDGAAFVLATGKMVGPRRTDWNSTGLVPKVAVAQEAPDDQVIGKAVDLLKKGTQMATAPTVVAR